MRQEELDLLRNAAECIQTALEKEKGRYQVAIGQRIRTLRVKKGMSLADLSHKSGLSAPFIKQMEEGAVAFLPEDPIRLLMGMGKHVTYHQLEMAEGEQVHRLRVILILMEEYIDLYS